MLTIPTTEPAAVIAGDTIKWTKSLTDFPASTYTLSYVLHLESAVAATPIIFNATAAGDDHAVTVAAATSALWAAGDYVWTSYATAGSERYTVDAGRVTVKRNPASIAAGTDLRSHSKIVLDAIEGVLEGRASKDQEEYRIGDRMLKRTPIKDLIELRSLYLSLYRQELAAAGKQPSRRYLMKL